MRDATDISIVLDRSGSMSSCVKDVIGGFNNFLKEQKELKSEATLSLYQFDGRYETVYINKPLNEVANLTEATFSPRGSTALYDAIGKTIADTGLRLSKMKESDRPNKVVVAIFTDGEENSSTEFSLEKINEMIEHQKSVYSWEILFIGSTPQARQSSQVINFAQNTRSPDRMSNNYQDSFKGLSAGVSNLRSYSLKSNYDANAPDNFFNPEEKSESKTPVKV